MFCPKCGSQLPDGSRFCPSCGAQIAAAPQTAQVPGARPVTPQATGAPTPQPAAAPQPRAAYAPAGSVPAPGAVRKHPRAGKVPVVAGAAVIALVAVVAAFFIVRALLGGGMSDDDIANNTNQALASLDGYDYFPSSDMGGIVRAKGTGAPELVYKLKNDDDNYEYEFPLGMAVVGGRLCFALYDTEDGDTVIHSTKPDGTDDKVVYTVEEGDDSASVSGLYSSGDRLYMLVVRYPSSHYEVDIVSMKVDGSDYKVESTLRSDDMIAPVIVRNRVFWCTKTSEGKGAVYSQKLDGSDSKQVYSYDGAVHRSPNVSGDRLVLYVYDDSSDTTRVVSIKQDGTDEKSLYTPPSGKDVDLLNVADGKAYLAQYDADAYDVSQYDVLSVPVAGGDPKTLMTNVDYYNPTLAVSDGHLVLSENGQDAGSYGMRVQAIDYDGKPIATYVS